MSGIEQEQNESNREENQPRYTRDEYNEWKPNADMPEYEVAIQEAIRRIKDEDALVRDELSIGVRVHLKPIDNPDITVSLVDVATAKLAGKAVDRDDETISEEEVVKRLEALLEHERNQ
ncbi:hypothetical protein [Haloarcula sp. Atlit-120R]|uniref:hypothetical protein n=1 Tax=Haloarcula sp. Atlit-120R TaxID=2282135 RepID=UPI000EF1ED68|nr:hypothetical protein [Haloarcula sp. Atlit-120R]RLM37220.1 hypothetical protein DVK01_11515 [Haloarcula sp. Atlit-120R]